jgi:hypothetical protein
VEGEGFGEDCWVGVSRKRMCRACMQSRKQDEKERALIDGASVRDAVHTISIPSRQNPGQREIENKCLGKCMEGVSCRLPAMCDR